ncbi:MAG TPA: putative DNA-binding domain-containing protein [Polyangiaceae bacterium]|nr:putative DNA-binding domain-containing protein [Polyangiaceae bacterium]
MPDPLELAIADACFGADDEALRDLRGFLEARGVPADDIEAILASPPRLAVYRSLVRNNLARVVARMLPRTQARMNAASEGRFDADLARFLDEVGPRTHYLRDVPHELFAWAEARWRRDTRVPAYLPDLAAYELAGFALGAAEAREDAPVTDVALDRPVVLAEAARLVGYAWAVHELADGDDPRDLPARREVHLLGYRDAEHAVRWLELTPLAAAIVGRLRAGDELGAAVAGACAAFDTAPADVGADVAKLLADLGERGVLRGGVPG